MSSVFSSQLLRGSNFLINRAKLQNLHNHF